MRSPQVIDPTPFDTAIRLERKLMAMLRRRVGADKADDAWSEVVLERICRVCELWDPTITPSLDAYVIRTMKMYAYKWVCTCAERVRQRATQSLPDDMSVEPPDDLKRAALLDLDEVLNELSEYDRWILRSIVIEGYTVSELSKSTGYSRPRLKASYDAALARAQDLAAAWAAEGRQREAT